MRTLLHFFGTTDSNTSQNLGELRWGGGGEQGRMRVGPGFWKAVFFFISFSGDSDIQSSGEATDKV